MKIKLILLVLFSFSIFLNAQKKGIEVKLSIIEKYNVDSIIINTPPLNMERLNATQYQAKQLSTPETALKAFTSFTTKEWGRAIVSKDYHEMFPDEEILKIHYFVLRC